MNKFILFSSIAAISFASAPVAAMPAEKPINAAIITDELFAEGCWVRASDADPYVYDPGCDSHAVLTRNADGSLRTVIYMDNSSLLADQIAPEHALRYTDQFPLFGLSCYGSEVITPSGEYMSHLRCR